MKKQVNAMILVGDVGGTKTRLFVFSTEGGPRRPVFSRIFRSENHDSLGSILSDFLPGLENPPTKAVFGVAGPVLSGTATVTNLPWVIEEASLRRQLGVPSVQLLNDLEATAYALPFLDPSERILLNPAQARPDGTLAVIAPGTGLGEAFLTRDASGFKAHPSEGGHVDFAPTDTLQIDLLRYLLDRMDHVSYERVCSGLGIPNLYNFFKDARGLGEPPWLSDQLVDADDSTPHIIEAATSTQPACSLCVEVLNTFISILGAAAGNLALKVSATGGVYIGGGIPPRIPAAFQNGLFMKAFSSKGRMSGLLEQIPVYLILKPETAVFGAACYGLGLDRPL
ncbi:MAG: glucokinase [Desulfobacterales bacterium]